MCQVRTVGMVRLVDRSHRVESGISAIPVAMVTRERMRGVGN